ncbi:calcium-dependent protein kinase 2-like [Bidens hawaiensis]|uniref:calcium-dependent protein kinase 2-like n=1 Tax=Bidens hawaiensis TaxID=980011 RepID=UPI0040496514
MGTTLSTGKKHPPPVAVAAEPAPPEHPLENLFRIPPTGSILGQQYKYVTEDFTLGKAIGSGKFAAIYICKEKSTGKKYACKQILKRILVTESQKEDLKREVRIMEHLKDQENCVQLKGAYEDRKCVHLVMEYCEAGALYDKMKSKGRYSEKVAAQILCSIMKVVNCLHFMGVMHRDLKPENFLLAKKAVCPCLVDYTMLKAIDFGLSAYIDEAKPSQEKVGTAFYVAPEVLMRKPYGKEVDIWSAGVILYMLLTGVPPFYGESEKAIFKAVTDTNPDMESYPWPHITENAKSLVKAMLSRNPKNRPTAAAVLNHQWLKDNGVATENTIDDMILKKMKYFRAMNIFKKLALKILADMTPGEEIEGLRAMFRNIDTNEEQVISRERLQESLVRIGSNLGPEDAKLIVEAADTDGNGYIDYNEFVTAMRNFSQYKEDYLFRAFMHFDKDSKGWISKEDLKAALEGYEAGDIKEIISEVDKIITEVDKNNVSQLIYIWVILYRSYQVSQYLIIDA